MKTLGLVSQLLRGQWTELRRVGLATFLSFPCGMLLTAIVYMPVTYGCFSIIREGTDGLSPVQAIGLAVMSVALAGVVLWFSGRVGAKRETGVQRAAQMIGVPLVVAAMCFALFALLSPYLAGFAAGQMFFPDTVFGRFCDRVTRYVAAISLVGGSATLAFGLCFGGFLGFVEMLKVIFSRIRVAKKSTTLEGKSTQL